MKKVMLVLYLACSFTALYANVTLIDVPKQSNVVDLSHIRSIEESIEDLVTGSAYAPIEVLTPVEARTYFADDLIQKYGKEKAEALMQNYFTRQHLGLRPSNEKQTLLDLRDTHRIMNDTLRDVLMKYKDADKQEWISFVKNKRKGWDLPSLLLTPEQAFDIFTKINTVARRNGIKSFDEFKKQFPDKGALFSSEFFGIPQDSQKRKDYFLHNSFKFFDQQFIRTIYQVAKRIMATTRQGDYIVIFGNTPYFVGKALQKISSSNPRDASYRTIIIFPFSGSPNTGRDVGGIHWTSAVTPERLDHLKRRLIEVGLSPVNKDLQKQRIYFVDVIGSGGGPAYVIEELIRMFQAADRKIPDINFISLNKINIHEEGGRNARIAKHDVGDGELLQLYFPNKFDPHFSIDTQVIYLPGHTKLDHLPSSAWRMFPEYQAYKWRPEYDAMLLKAPRTQEQQLLLDYFTINLEHIMQKKD